MYELAHGFSFLGMKILTYYALITDRCILRGFSRIFGTKWAPYLVGIPKFIKVHACS